MNVSILRCTTLRAGLFMNQKNIVLKASLHKRPRADPLLLARVEIGLIYLIGSN